MLPIIKITVDDNLSIVKNGAYVLCVLIKHGHHRHHHYLTIVPICKVSFLKYAYSQSHAQPKNTKFITYIKNLTSQDTIFMQT